MWQRGSNNSLGRPTADISWPFGTKGKLDLVKANDNKSYSSAFLALRELLPRPARQAAFSRFHGLRVDRVVPQDDQPAMAPVIVVGALRAPTGLGQAARLALSALQASGIKHGAIDLTEALFQPATEPLGESMPPTDGVGSLLVYVTPPNGSRALGLIPPHIRNMKRRIAGWVCETEDLPAMWEREAKHFHVLTAPSRFAAEAIGRRTGRLVRVIGHPVDVEPVRSGSARPAVAPTIGAMLDVSSSFHRKNLSGLAHCLHLVCRARPDVRLILKIRAPGANSHAHTVIRELKLALQDRCEIIDDDQARADIADFYARIHLLVSLSRAEGFGLPYAEAIRHGVIVAAPRWGGPADFLDDTNSLALPYDLTAITDADGHYGANMGDWADVDPQKAATVILDYLHRHPRLLDSVFAPKNHATFSVDHFILNLMEKAPFSSENIRISLNYS